eukprot:767633-Hanusia_phi.AAC.8
MQVSCTPIPVPERSAAHRPCARSYHAACAIDDQWVVVHGGWTGLKPLSCCWALNMETFSWIQIKFVGEQPSARQGHSITFFPKARRLFLFGGLDASGAVVKDKAYFLSVPHDLSERWQWQPVRLAGLSRTIGGIMVDRAFHSTSDIGNEKIVVFGGICDEITSKHHSSMLFQCDTASFSCHEPKAYGEGPCSRYAHSSCSLESGANGREVIIIGGMKSDTREILCDGFVLEVHPTAVRWSKINFQGDLLSKFSVAFHTVSPVTAGLMVRTMLKMPSSDFPVGPRQHSVVRRKIREE